MTSVNKQYFELNTIYEKVRKENSDLNEELKFVKEESHQKSNKINYLETINKQLTYNISLKKLEDQHEGNYPQLS